MTDAFPSLSTFGLHYSCGSEETKHSCSVLSHGTEGGMVQNRHRVCEALEVFCRHSHPEEFFFLEIGD